MARSRFPALIREGSCVSDGVSVNNPSEGIAKIFSAAVSQLKLRASTQTAATALNNRSQHVPVMLGEVLEALAPAPGKIILDGTLGGGGHALALAQRVAGSMSAAANGTAARPKSAGFVIAMDRDSAAVERAEATLRGLPVVLAAANYADAPEILHELSLAADAEHHQDIATGESLLLDGILLDLGLSSDQLADDERGFSFESPGPLDLRFDPTRGEPAWRLITKLRPENLADVIYQYGEERMSRRIARALSAEAAKRELRSAAEIADIIRRSVPASARYGRIHPATRTFQALRIAVNEELKWLEIALRRLPDLLKPGGRFAAISFHSLEDRRVKQAFRNDPRLSVITNKPLRPTEEECASNPRSRSAKLRVAERQQPA